MAVELDEENLYKKIADNFDWEYILGEFSKFYCPNNGRNTISTRLKVGLLIAKHLQQTSDDNLSAGEIIEAYQNLWKIKESFRVLKTNLETRPVYH